MAKVTAVITVLPYTGMPQILTQSQNSDNKLNQARLLGLGPRALMALLPNPHEPKPKLHMDQGSNAIFRPRTETPVPEFAGKLLDVCAEDPPRFLGATGRETLGEQAKADLVVASCQNKLCFALKMPDCCLDLCFAL